MKLRPSTTVRDKERSTGVSLPIEMAVKIKGQLGTSLFFTRLRKRWQGRQGGLQEGPGEDHVGRGVDMQRAGEASTEAS